MEMSSRTHMDHSDTTINVSQLNTYVLNCLSNGCGNELYSWTQKKNKKHISDKQQYRQMTDQAVSAAQDNNNLFVRGRPT